MGKIEEMTGLPENAYRELQSGETYEPIMSPNKTYPEVNTWSVTWGLLMAILFSAAAAYLGLKIGQVFEAAIPIAIIAVGASSLAKRKNSLGENVIIQSIGASSGVIVAGAIFTLPALYILGLDAKFYQVFLSSLFGGFLGILFLIPFRKYFVSDMHGKYPFPEATATTEVLVSGAKGGNQAKVLLVSGLVGGLYDFCFNTFGWWKEVFTTRVIPAGAELAEKTKIVFKLNITAAVLGLGYIIGLKYAAIICAGSFVAWYVLLPLIAEFGAESTILVSQGADLVPMLVKDASAEQIFAQSARLIGIGAIAMAGLVGIIRSSGIIKSAFGLAARELTGKSQLTGEVKRTQRDLPMKIIAIGVLVTLLLILIFFWAGIIHNFWQAFLALLIVAIIAFLFTTVAANAIAIVGSNPVSGMTLMTLIITSLVMVAAGLSGTAGMVAALIIGGVVCTALSMAGGFITDLKVGYWLGTTPIKQQSWKFLGTFISAATVGGVIMLLNKTYGFTGVNALEAPQANAMAAVIKPMMSGGATPWLLYGIGVGLTLILTMIGLPALPFALGMFIPIHLNTPLLIGGLISWFVTTRSKDRELNKVRQERGTLIASGLIAGGALLGVVSSVIKFIQNLGADAEKLAIGKGITSEQIAAINDKHSFVNQSWANSNGAEWLSLIMFALLCGYIIWDTLKAKRE